MISTRSNNRRHADDFERVRCAIQAKLNPHSFGEILKDRTPLFECIDWAHAKPYGPRKIFKASSSTLLGQPTEIREMIWTYTLAEDKRLLLDTHPGPALARVSRQLRGESLPIFLRINKFHIVFAGTDDDTHKIDFLPTTLSWLREVGLGAPLFYNIQISFGGTCTYMLYVHKRDADGDLALEHACSERTCCFCEPTALRNRGFSDQHPWMDLQRRLGSEFAWTQNVHDAHVQLMYGMGRVVSPRTSASHGLSLHDLHAIASSLDEQKQQRFANQRETLQIFDIHVEDEFHQIKSLRLLIDNLRMQQMN